MVVARKSRIPRDGFAVLMMILDCSFIHVYGERRYLMDYIHLLCLFWFFFYVEVPSS